MCNFYFLNCVDKNASVYVNVMHVPANRSLFWVKQKLQNSKEVNLKHAGRIRHAQTLPAWL
jgi:hypothetical protein